MTNNDNWQDSMKRVLVPLLPTQEYLETLFAVWHLRQLPFIFIRSSSNYYLIIWLSINYIYVNFMLDLITVIFHRQAVDLKSYYLIEIMQFRSNECWKYFWNKCFDENESKDLIDVSKFNSEHNMKVRRVQEIIEIVMKLWQGFQISVNKNQ